MSSDLIIDVTNFCEKLPDSTSQFVKNQEVFRLIIRSIRIFINCHTVIVVTHPSQEVDERVLSFLQDCNLSIFDTMNYDDFGKILTADSILVSKDQIFYQFLKKFPLKARMASIYSTGEYQTFTSDFLDERYGTFQMKDWHLYLLTKESKRLNYQKLRSTLSQAYRFNHGIYQNSPAHRFWQTQEARERAKNMLIKYQTVDVDKKRIIDIDFDYMIGNIDQYFPSSKKMIQRLSHAVSIKRKAYINSIQK